MVFFTCSGCGRSLKKNQVERHIHNCHGYQYMTCIDCSKDFWGNDYNNHNRCLTENEKYGGSNYVQKEFKGMKKQEAWINQIHEHIAATQNMNPQLKSLFEHIMKFDNIPRKRAKFMNFLKSNNYKNPGLVEEAWTFFEKASRANNTPNQQDFNKSTETEAAAEPVKVETQEEHQSKSKRQKKEERRQKQNKVEKKDEKKKADDDDCNEVVESRPKKKRKRKEEEEENDQENEEPKKKKKSMKEEGIEPENEPGKDLVDSQDQDMIEVDITKKSGSFSWKKAITFILQNAPEEGMKVKKLKRKLTALYMGTKCEAAARKTPMEIDALIGKKLNMKNDKYVFVKDKVKLRESS